MRDLNSIEILSTTGGEAVLDMGPREAFKWAGATAGAVIGWTEGKTWFSWHPDSVATDFGGYTTGIVGAMAGAAVGGFVGKFTAGVVLPAVL
jgi:hypothetical protein